MKNEIIHLPEWLRVDGVIWLAAFVDAVERDAAHRGRAVYMSGANGATILEFDGEKSEAHAAEDYIRRFISDHCKHLTGSKKWRSVDIFDRAQSNTKRIRHHMKTILPNTESVKETNLPDWLQESKGSKIEKSLIWEFAQFEGWTDKKGFFKLHFPECPNGKVYKEDGICKRGFSGINFTKNASIKLKLKRRMKK